MTSGVPPRARGAGTARAAGILVGAEGVALAVLAGWQVVALVTENVASTESAIALIVLTVLGAACVIAFGAAVVRHRSWGRSGGIVTQLLILAVAFGAVTGAYAHPMIALLLAVPALVALALLIVVARNASPARGDR